MSRLPARSIPHLATLCAVVAGAVLFSPSGAQAQGRGGSVFDADLGLVEAEILGIERRVAALRGEIAGGSLTRSSRVVSERFTEAKSAYLFDDYERCALVFYSLLEGDDLRSDPRRSEAQWYLAECLFLDGNLRPAQDEFQRIVDAGNSHPYYGDSLLKLIELFGLTGDVDRFNEYYNRFVRQSMDSSPTSLRIRYEMGKTLYSQGKLDDAQAIFGGFPRGSGYTPQAHYISGAILVEQGREAAARGDADLAKAKYEQAIVKFKEVLTLPGSTPEHQQVFDLCHLALGRLHYELGDIPSAISEYGKVEADSGFYADALFEMIWANIEAAAQMSARLGRPASPGAPIQTPAEAARKYEEALRAIEIFGLAYPDDARDSTLRLLAGHVRVRMDQYEEAIEKYEGAASHFRELKQEVDKIVGSGADPMVYFNQLVGEGFVAEADLTVPPAARLQARADEKVAHAVEVSGDLYRQQGAIDQAGDVLDVLEAALREEDPQGLIQSYRTARQQLASAEAAGLMLRSRLLEVEMAWLDANLSGAARGDLRSVQEEFGHAQGAAVSVARDRQQIVELQEAFDLQADAVEARAYHVELAIKDLLGQATAIEEYLVDARARGERTREQEIEARESIKAERAQLGEWLDALREAKKRLEPRVLTGRLGSARVADEGSQRAQARSSLSRTEARLSALRGRATSGGDFFRRLDAARSRLMDLERISTDARDKLDRGEAAELGDIRDEVSFQRRTVSDLDREGARIAGQNQTVSGRIGRQAFVNVAAFYEDMLTRADMGVADVYWYRKETTGKAREDLTREKVRRLRALEDAFESVLGE